MQYNYYRLLRGPFGIVLQRIIPNAQYYRRVLQYVYLNMRIVRSIPSGTAVDRGAKQTQRQTMTSQTARKHFMVHDNRVSSRRWLVQSVGVLKGINARNTAFGWKN